MHSKDLIYDVTFFLLSLMRTSAPNRLSQSSAFTPTRRSPLGEDLRSNTSDKENIIAVPPVLCDRLRDFPLFQNAPPAFFDAIVKSLNVVQFHPQEYIVKYGEPACAMYWVLRGTVNVTSPDGEATYAELQEGSFFGEIGIMFNRPRTATVVARTRVLVGVLKKDSFTQILPRFPSVERFIRDQGQDRLARQGRVSVSAVSPIVDDFIPVYHFLENCDMFSCLTERTLKELAQQSGLKSYENEHQFSCDSIDLNIVFSGEVEECHTKARLGPECVIGESIELDTTQDKQTVSEITATAPSIILTIPSIALRKVCQSFPKVVERLLSEISKRGQQKKQTRPLLENVSWNYDLKPKEVQLDQNKKKRSLPTSPPSFLHSPQIKRLKSAKRRSSILVCGPLPDSIFLKVFSLLDLRTMMRASSVCHRWRDMLYYSDSLCREVDLKLWNKTIDDSALMQIVNFVGTRARSINISNCFHITDEGFSYMVNEIGIRGQIEVLKMQNTWSISAMAIMDLASPSVGRYLQEIELSNCRKVRDDVVIRLIGYRDPYQEVGCPNLKRMNLGYCKGLTDRTMKYLADNACDRLESLNLARCTTISDNGFLSWQGRQFPHLQKLVLKDCSFLSDRAISSLATCAPNLIDLDLSFCCVLQEPAIDILCVCCQSLQRLNLSFCGAAVSDNSLISISRLNQLRQLIIVGCVRVTRQGIDLLLTNSRNVNHLNISQCPRVCENRGRHVKPFETRPGTRSAFLKVSPYERIVEVVL